jgi:putative transposase
MILTYKVKHERDFSEELVKAKKVAVFAVEHRTLSSKDVKHIGLKSVISNQILRKYGRDKKIKRVKSVNLIIPNQGIKINQDDQIIEIPSLKLSVEYQFPNNFNKVNQIEINNEYIFVSVTVLEIPEYEPEGWIGVDLNTTGHIAVIADPDTGKIHKLGKKAQHIHTKYKETRRQFQSKGKYGKVKDAKNRESRIVKDLNHKISKKIVEVAKDNQNGIKLEDLTGIRNNKKHTKSFRYSLNSWSFYQLKQMIEYKAKLQGVPLSYIDPAYTSQKCSRCGLIGDRNGKSFKCPSCGHVDHADVNAAFNISFRQQSIDQSIAERDVMDGNTDIPKAAMACMQSTVEPHEL